MMNLKARIVPILGIIAMIAVIGFSMAACKGGDDDDGGGGGGNGTRDPKTYTGTAASGVTYRLRIEDSGARGFNAGARR